MLAVAAGARGFARRILGQALVGVRGTSFAASVARPLARRGAFTALGTTAAVLGSARLATMAPGDSILVNELVVRNTIGVDSWERVKKQDIVITLRISSDLMRAGVLSQCSFRCVSHADLIQGSATS